MEEREPIQVSFRLPAGTLDGLSRLVEQLRLLAAEMGGGMERPPTQPDEHAWNNGFDSRRYEAMRQGPEVIREEAAQAAQEKISGLDAPQTVQGEAETQIAAPKRAADATETTSARPQDAEAAKVDFPQEDGRKVRTAEAAHQKPLEEPAVVRAAAESRLEDPMAARIEPESQTAEAEAPWDQEVGEGPDVQAMDADVFSGETDICSAGFTPASAPAETYSKWSSAARELTEEGAAPLTAEAVSLAFRRDGRRYDNGFPLY